MRLPVSCGRRPPLGTAHDAMKPLRASLLAAAATLCTLVVAPGAPADLPGSLLNVHAVFIDGRQFHPGRPPAGG
jgi:hypothetical protein